MHNNIIIISLYFNVIYKNEENIFMKIHNLGTILRYLIKIIYENKIKYYLCNSYFQNKLEEVYYEKV